MNIYPWQKDLWEIMFSNKTKMPHALLFYGAKTSEINKFVNELVKSLLCNKLSEENFSCGECENCIWDLKNHPDLKIIESDSEKSEKLSVTNVREVKKFLELSSHQTNGKKIVTICNADKLTIAASNSLLKTIEEPPNDCLIILTVKDVANLLPTITSRCRLICFSKPTIEQAKEFLNKTDNKDLISNLELYNNSPLDLLADKETMPNINSILNELKKGRKIDLMNINNYWFENGLFWIINLLQKWAYELLLFKLCRTHNYFPNEKEYIVELSENADLTKLLSHQKSLIQIKSYAETAVNSEINLYSVMIEYKKMFKV